MQILQRYILAELLKVFAYLLTGLTVLLVFVGVFRQVSDQGIGAVQILQILPFLVPSMMPFTIPATFLLTVCVVYGRIAGDNEVIAAKAAGINVISLLWPAFMLGAVLSVGSFLLADRATPWAMLNIQRIGVLAMEDIFLDLLSSRHVFKDVDRGFSISVLAVEGKRLIFPTFEYAPRGREPYMIQAEEATLEFNLKKEEVVLHLINADIDTPGRVKVQLKDYRVSVPLPQEIKKAKPRNRSIVDIQQNARELRNAMERARQRRDVTVAFAVAEGDLEALTRSELNIHNPVHRAKLEELARLSTEMHSRFSLSASCLLFTLLGGPFSIAHGRRQFLTNFFVCFLPILVVYYPVVLLLTNLSRNGDVNPAWAMWLGNAIVLAISVQTLRKVLKH